MFDRNDKGMWWDRSWNPIRLKEGYGFGCTKVSPGCANCWAERYSRRFYKTPPYDGRKREFILNQKVLTEPLRARKPRVYFVCDLMDLFHKDVSNLFINEVFHAMAAAASCGHIFVLLTKRAKRMASLWPFLKTGDYVWPGVSVEDQKTADERIPILLQVTAAVIVVSYEPALGSLILPPGFLERGKRAWCIVGGETGPGARPMNPDWVNAVKTQCICASVPFFFKQWGKWKEGSDRRFENCVIFSDGRTSVFTKEALDDIAKERGAGYANSGTMIHKPKQAGRLLDGKEYNEIPERGDAK